MLYFAFLRKTEMRLSCYIQDHGLSDYSILTRKMWSWSGKIDRVELHSISFNCRRKLQATRRRSEHGRNLSFRC